MLILKICICEHLKSLSQAFDNYYPQEDIRAGYLWILNPLIEAQNYKLTNIEEESLLELSSSIINTGNDFWKKNSKCYTPSNHINNHIILGKFKTTIT